MITKHARTHFTLSDGKAEHSIAYADIQPMKPHGKGGIHPGVTDDHQGWLAIDPGADMTNCPMKPTPVVHEVDGAKVTVNYLPITAYLQAHYGRDKQVVTVPINGDANAQRLHWLHRNKKERAEMKAILEWMGAWRLDDDGNLPKEQ